MMEENKTKRRLIISVVIIIILLLVIGGLSIYIITDKNNDNNINQLNNNTINTNTIIQNNTANNQNTVKMYNKLLNPYEEGTICANTFDESMGIRLSFQNDGKAYLDVLEGKEYFENLGMEMNVSMADSYEITGLSKKIVDTYIGFDGNGYGYPKAYFLLEDGTVWYLNTESFMINGNTKVEGKVNGVEGVVKFKYAALGVPNDGGWLQVIGIKADGSFYAL